jgi:SPP1 family phage portal protein
MWGIFAFAYSAMAYNMEKEELEELLGDPKKLVETVTDLAPEIPEYVYDIEPENHKVVKDILYRPWRDVEIATGVLDASGNMTYRTEKRDVHRIPSNTQKQITEWAVRMALSGGIEIEAEVRDGNATDETMLAMLKKTWEDNKLDYIAQKIDKIKKNYTQCLVVWYSVPIEEGFWTGIAPDATIFKMECSLYSPEDGNIIIPLYDQYRKMIACARKYTVKVDKKDVNKMDLFTTTAYITFSEAEGAWAQEKKVDIKYGKANFVFHGQKRPQYADVLPKIERVEEGDSDTADENQQSAFPILAATGEIIASSGGGTKNTRKSFQLADGGDLKYVEAKGSQQSAKDERENLRRDIYDETNTPQISMEQIKGSSNIPGVAIEMMFLPATNQAKSDQQGDLGMEWQRHLNFLKSALAVLNIAVKPSVSMPVKPKFKIELPRNLTEEYQRIVQLVGAGLMSIETAVKTLGFTDNIVEEMEKIEAEVAKRDAAKAQA